MTYDKLELGGALSDVRRAYRLLWAYQRRMNDLADTLSHHLGFRDYYTEPEKLGGWGRLPMVSYGYVFVRTTAPDSSYLSGEWMNFPKADDMLLYLWLESDTELTRAIEPGLYTCQTQQGMI